MKNNLIKSGLCLSATLCCILFSAIPSTAANTPSINAKTKSVYVSKTTLLTVANANKKVKWTTSNKNIATIVKVSGKKSCKAKIQGKKTGKATITAKVGNKKLSCQITVKKKTTTAVKYYITETGSKYHISGCSSLRKSKIEISLADAKAQGYTACGICLK